MTSNTRTSTYKLHMRPSKEIRKLEKPIDAFKAVAVRNIQNHREVGNHLRTLKRLKKAVYFKPATVRWQDVAAGFSSTFDIMMTSPPYGDNVSTVPYGQSAYLPLHWIDLADIDVELNPTLLKTTYEIDKRSLGGRRARHEEMATSEDLRSRSALLDVTLRRLGRKPRDRAARVLGFVRDLDAVLPKLVSSVKVNGYLVWTVGNRRVGGLEVPLAGILQELMSGASATLVAKCARSVKQKRMPFRNSISATMKKEQVLVFRRVA